MKKISWIAALLAALALVFTACSGTTTDPVDPGQPGTEYWTVTFNVNGGDGQNTTAQVVKGETATKPTTDPVRVGYDFINWFESATADVDTAGAFDFSTPITSNKTLYAGWKQDTQNTYWTVTFNLNGGGTTFTRQALDGGKVTRPADPTHTSSLYTFVDWFESDDADPDTDEPFDFDTLISAAKTLYAIWELEVNTEDNFIVTFWNGATAYATVVIPKDAAIPTVDEHYVEELDWPPEQEDWIFIGWFEDENDPDERFDFETEITDDLDIYAVFGQISEVIEINDGQGEFEDTFWLGYGNYDGPLVKYNGQTAIQIRPDSEIKGNPPAAPNDYRMGFYFDPLFDISAYGTIELDFAWEGNAPSFINISLFANNETQPENPDKIMFYPGSGTDGKIIASIGNNLWYKSRDMVGIELWTEPITDDTCLYITRLAVSGTALAEPEEDPVPVAATGISLSGTSTEGTSTSLSLSTTPSPQEGYSTVYVHFTNPLPANTDYSSIEIIFARTGGGGNTSIRGGIDASGEKGYDSDNDPYLGWMGYGNPPRMKRDPVDGIHSELDKTTLKAVKFEFEGKTDTLELVSVNFYKFKE